MYWLTNLLTVSAPLSNCLGKYAILVYVEKIFEHCHFVQNFPPVPEMISHIQFDPFPVGYGVYFKY